MRQQTQLLIKRSYELCPELEGINWHRISGSILLK